jgi:murein DD-endopeptidase MepM/ murein hydrolase activator NlpD
LKRAFPQKVRLGDYQISENVDLVGSPATKVFANGNRRTRTSAAMVGLALSMGASSLLIPRHDDGAAAAEARSGESTVAQLPDSFYVAAASVNPDTNLPSHAIEHVVQPGQTLWQISQQYRVPVDVIAIANDFSVHDPIRVGQILRIPAATASVSSSLVASATPTASPTPFQETTADRALQAEQQVALESMAEKRQQLSDSLAALNNLSTGGFSVAVPSEGDPAVNARKPAVAGRVASEQSQVPRQSIAATPSPEPTPIVQEPVVPQVAASAQIEEAEVSLTPEAEAGTATVDRLNSLEVPPAIAALPVEETTSTLSSAETDIEPSPSSIALHPSALQSEPVEPVTSIIYHVEPGDTVSSLARKYNVPVGQLVSENNISNPNYIFVGQTLQIPVAPQVEAVVESTPTLVAQRLDSELTLASPTEAQEDMASSDAQPPLSTVPQQLSALPQAISPEAEMPESSILVQTEETNPYVANLLQEIRIMSDRYREANRTEAATTVPAEALEVAAEEQLQVSLADPIAPIPEVPSSPTVLAVSPTFSERSGAPQISVTTQATEPMSEEATEAIAEADERQLVAVAPLGSENYQPLLEPITGRMVSPELPPLPSAEEFLPSATPEFSGYIWPAQGVLTSGYGWRWGRMHHGIDIAGPIGTPIYAAAPGVVEYAGWNSGGYGNMIEVRHPDGSMTRYAHLDSVGVRSGQAVKQGEQIGEMGSTGYSTGPHLHFEVHLANRGGTVNPIAYLP